ncbi:MULTISPECIES: ATP-dependent nuclease [Pelosinus]|uniref:SMC domain protein n=1 Tax=Pelosinus fermentans B4 TaxID=1149862 RepID=I9LAN8_9FIRM|nr:MULTISPECIES: ATP-binding protein [Pelosinus]EIW17356.1 hypothetical protein FB4_4105 [Pelosinus fermentans B4]EIW23415.1 hypothetical protein FA11_4107 [Pelosinus fermentans A11]
MRIKHLKINNYKGIHELEWEIPNRMVCLIGPGDSTKSTILDAIELALWPSWNLQIIDNDFYQGSIKNEIQIEVTVGEFPQEFLSDEKYGLYLRGDINSENDEPIDGDDSYLTVRLTVGDSLEPEWLIVNNRSEGKKISYKDRAKLCTSRVGVNFDKDFTLGKSSVLNRLSSQITGLNDLLLSTSRDVCMSTDLDCNVGFSDIIDQMTISARDYGVKPHKKFNAKIDIKAFNMGASAIAVHDGEVPLRLSGLGTRRLISMGLNMNCSDIGSMVLIDEVENGLEPYRLRNLLKKLKMVIQKCGQVIITSHSPITVIELPVENIVIVRSEQGKTECKSIGNDLQAIVRRMPEAILSPRVLVCEGKTEYGICMALDKNEDLNGRGSIACEGVCYIEGGGDEAYKRASEIRKLGYEVALFIDSDVLKVNIEADKLKALGVEIIRWADNVSTDERIFLDLPWMAIQDMIDIAVEGKGEISVLDSIRAKMGREISTTNVKDWTDLEKSEGDIRIALGELAKSKSGAWYKRVDLGEQVGKIVMKHYGEIEEQNDLGRVIKQLKGWIYGPDIYGRTAD